MKSRQDSLLQDKLLNFKNFLERVNSELLSYRNKWKRLSALWFLCQEFL